MNRSESIANLAAALATAQERMKAAEKDATNPAFKSRYATLAAIFEAAKPALAGTGLSVLQFPSMNEAGRVAVESVLLHKSGEYVAGVVEIPVTRQDAQGIGSAVTYGRRYGLSALPALTHERCTAARWCPHGHIRRLVPSAGSPTVAPSPLSAL